MPLAPMFYEPMVKPFRDMLADVDARGLQGPDVDEMRARIAEMESLAQQCGDIGAYTGQLAQRNTFQAFSDAYSRALSAEAKAKSAAGGGSDEELLADAVRAYESALSSYESGQAGEQAELLIPPVKRILELARSGVSYPVFLRKMEEEGLNRALEGSAPATRTAIESAIAFGREHWDRFWLIKHEQELAIFDQLAQKAPFGQPDPLEHKLRRRRMEWELEPLQIRWEAEVDRWQQLLTYLVDWIDAFTGFAPGDERWAAQDGNPATTQKNIERTQECEPGNFRYHEAVFQRYFHYGWNDLWQNETFIWEYTANRVEYSDARLSLMQQTYAHCVPGGKPPAELIARAEELHPAGDYRPNKLQPPPWGTPLRGFSG